MSKYDKYLSLIDNLKIENFENKEEEIRIYIYKEHLKRILKAVELLEIIEKKIFEEIDNIEIKDLIKIHQQTLKSIEVLKSTKGHFEPLLKSSKDIKEAIAGLGLSPDDDEKQIIKKIIITQVANLVSEVNEVQKALNKYQLGSISHWKAQETLKSLTQVIHDLLKSMERLEKETGEENNVLTVQDILDMYAEIQGNK